MFGNVVLIASTGPFGPTLTSVALLLLVLVGPFLLLAIAARSLLGTDPVPVWLLMLMALGTAGAAFLIWPARITDRWTGFWGVWRIASMASLVLMPVVLFLEAGKRDFFRRPDRAAKRPSRKRRAKRNRSDEGVRPTGGDCVFVRDDS